MAAARESTALLSNLPELVLTGMTSPMQSTLVRMLRRKGVKILAWHASFYGPTLPAKDILRFLVAVATVRQVGRAEKCFALARKFRLHSAL